MSLPSPPRPSLNCPTAQTFAGLHNYVHGITQMNFLSSFGYSAIITISSVVLILLCCSHVRLVYHPA